MGALILVHGLAHGAWCWSRTRADLVARGHDVLAVDLPLTGLDEDAAAVLCARDRAIHPDFQRWMSTRAGEVVVLDTDHSPFMSSPEQSADLLAGIVDDTKHGVARPTC
jgi:alpha-beta hydrolase superfamily lysophospholipase